MTKANHKSNPLFLSGCNIAFAVYADLVIDPLNTEAASLLSHHAVSGRMLHFGCKCKVDDDKE